MLLQKNVLDILMNGFLVICSTKVFFLAILQVTMVYSSASVAEMLVLQDLHELCGFWNFQLEVFLSSGEVMVGRW